MMRKLPRYGALSLCAGLGLVVLTASFLMPLVHASSADLKLIIEKPLCTADTTFSYSSNPSLIWSPAYCDRLQPEGSEAGVGPKTQDQYPDVQTARLVPENSKDRRPGNQYVLENSIYEPLAYWAGIGNSTVSVARPIFLIFGTCVMSILLIDGIALEWRLMRFFRRTLGKARQKAMNR